MTVEILLLSAGDSVEIRCTFGKAHPALLVNAGRDLSYLAVVEFAFPSTLLMP